MNISTKFGAILAINLLHGLISGCATTTAGGEQIAKELSAQVLIVAEQGRRFAVARDQLARNRLDNIHMLENSAVETRSAIELDRVAWRVAGATFRTTLYDAVLEATALAEEQRQAAEERRRQQAAARARTESAVNIREDKLLQASRALAQLAAPSDERAVRSQFTKQIMKGLDEDLTAGLLQSEAGQLLTNKLTEKSTALTFQDKLEILKNSFTN